MTIIYGAPVFLGKVAWNIINFSIIGLAVVAIILAIISKDKLITKALSVLFVVILPPIGSLFVFGRLLYRRSRKRNTSDTDEPQAAPVL